MNIPIFPFIVPFIGWSSPNYPFKMLTYCQSARNWESYLEIKSSFESAELVVIELDVSNLDASNIAVFRTAVQPVIEKFAHVVFDMTGVQFVDSSGLGALIACQRVLKGRHGALRLASMGASVRALFELTRMHRVFQIYGTRNDAVEACRKALHLKAHSTVGATQK